MKAGLKISADASVVQGPRGLSIKEFKFKETLSNGDNIYQIILENGQVIGELVSKKGDKGLKGDTGKNGRGIVSTAFNRKENDCRYYDIFYTDNTKEEFFVENGISAYEIALDNGFIGTEGQWLESLIGRGLEFEWKGTQLGVRVQGEQEYKYVDLSFQSTDFTDIGLLIGECYKGIYDPDKKYYSGDVYYKTDTTVLSVVIPDKKTNTIAVLIPNVASPVISKQTTSEDTGETSKPDLNKNSYNERINRFFRLYGEIEKEFDLIGNGDNEIVGIALGNNSRFIRTNSALELEFNTINYILAVNIPSTQDTMLEKTMTSEQNSITPTLIKKQYDLPLYANDTQKETKIRKINY